MLVEKVIEILSMTEQQSNGQPVTTEVGYAKVPT
jgi:hypothetical protein